MTDALPPDCQIRPASPDQREAALTLLFSGASEAERDQHWARFLAHAQANPWSPDGLLEARRGAQVIGVVWAEVVSPSAAIVWPPCHIAGESPAVTQALLDSATQWLAGRGIRLAQTLLTTDASQESEWFAAAGFQPLADLVYLLSLPGQFPTTVPATELQFEPFSATGDESRLAAVIEATYQQSLDCPTLNGIRPIADVLCEYRQAGKFDPGLWFFVRHAGRDVGCLLLADYPDTLQLNTPQVELVYMGLVPEARGRGWGVSIVRHAQWLTRSIRRPRLVVAVDSANSPALDMYFAAGFTEFDRRRFWGKMADFPEDHTT